MNREAWRRALRVQLNGHSLQQAEHKRDFAMKQQEIHLIDRAALRRLMESCPNLSRLQLAQILIGQLKEDLDGMEAERLSFLYNYFVLVGPSDDPAGVKDAGDVKAAFKAIADGKYKFVSRGDGSGTHTKELSLWPEELGITAEQESFADYTDWYVSSNAGMGVCLTMANEQGAYILSDKATFLTFRANDGVIEG